MNIKERIAYIRKNNEAAKKDTERPTYAVKHWRENQTLNLKIIRLDAKYLMYRIDNSRTEIQQLAYLRKNPKLSRDLFKDPESSEAQEAQENILNQINKAAGNDFISDLKKGQDDPAIITYDGYLVNGNRRTAALKSLGVNYINCVVLPEETTPKDIYEQEQILQISQDFREPYHWINELRNIKRGLEDKDLNINERDMASRLRIDPKELTAKKRMLEILDSFLIWKRIPGQYDYSKLEDTEQIFIQLEKAIKRFKSSKTFDELKNAVFTLIEEKPLKGRLYGYVIDLIKNFDSVYDKVKSNTVVKKQKKKAVTKKSNNILDTILEDEEEVDPIFNDPKNAPSLASIIVEKIADVKAENKEKTDNEAVYESVSTALRELHGLKLDKDTKKVDSIKSKLEQIIELSKGLLKEVKEFGK